MDAQRRVKIVVTVGPASWLEETLQAIGREGVEGFRFNFSHFDHENFRRAASYLRSLENPLRPLTLIADLQGPVVMLGEFSEFPVKAGDTVKFVPAREAGEGVPVDKVIFSVAAENDILSVEAGRLAFRVLRNDGHVIAAQALVDGLLKPRKTLAIKGKDLPLPSLTQKDLKDLKFAVEAGFDAVALSFVRRAEDVARAREVLEDLGASDVRLIAKIETGSAVENIDRILDLADGILVARGDLANYYDLEKIYSVQQFLISKARQRGKPSIVATQLLESMIDNPVPTRSEVVDVVTAVKMGADALMLAGETAAGKYPLEAVRWLKKIALEAAQFHEEEAVEPGSSEAYEVIARGVVALADIISGKILAFSEGGNTARRLAKYRPRGPVIVYTNRLSTARYANLLRGLIPVYMPDLAKTDVNLFERMLEHAVSVGLVSAGDIVVFTAGRRPGATDLITVEKVKPKL
ncbi:MAG: pyruvate kinase [Thermofilum sp.]